MREMTRLTAQEIKNMRSYDPNVEGPLTPTGLRIWQAICDLALTARSEGFREGVEAAARVCENLSFFTDVSVLRGMTKQEMSVLTCKEAAAEIRALSPRETDADPQEPSGKSPGPAGNSGHKQNSPRGEPVRDVPAASAPSGEVAEMVRRLEHLRFRYAGEIPPNVIGILSDAAALLEKVGQGPCKYSLPGQEICRYLFQAIERGDCSIPPPPERP